MGQWIGPVEGTVRTEGELILRLAGLDLLRLTQGQTTWSLETGNSVGMRIDGYTLAPLGTCSHPSRTINILAVGCWDGISETFAPSQKVGRYS